MDIITKSWADRYYYYSMGREVGDPVKDFGLETVEETYRNEFINPLKIMLRQDLNSELPQDVISKTVMLLCNSNCTVWPYMLNYWIREGYFDGKKDTFQQNLKDCVERFTVDHKLLYATTGYDATDIVVFGDKNNKPVGTYPYRVFTYIGMNSTVKGRLLKKLAEKDPTTLTNKQIILLRKAVEFGIMPETVLQTSSVLIPGPYGELTRMNVNIMSNGFPPAEIMQLINSLPSATIMEWGNDPYIALKHYVEETNLQDKSVLNYLNSIESHFDSRKMPVAPVAPVSLTDEDVKSYLAKQYGIVTDDLSKLNVGISQHMRTAVEMNPDLLSGTASDLINAASDNANDDFVSGTLDEVILNYCKDEGIDTECSISQLIQYINEDITIEPKTFENMAESYIARTGNKFATLAEVAGIMSADEANLNATEQFLINDSKITESLASGLLDIIKSDKFSETAPAGITDLVSYETLIDEIERAGKIDNKLANCLKNAKSSTLSSEDVANLHNAERSAEDVAEEEKSIAIDYIGRLGLPLPLMTKCINAIRTNAKVVLEPEAAPDIKAEMSKKFADIGLPVGISKAILDAMETDGYVALPTAYTAESTYDESGYKLAESMLRSVRQAIAKDSSIDNRSKYTPILYSFLRLLMCDPKTEHDDLVEFLNGKKADASNEAKAIIDEALENLK